MLRGARAAWRCDARATALLRAAHALLPLVVEANALADALNRPVVFTVELLTRREPDALALASRGAGGGRGAGGAERGGAERGGAERGGAGGGARGGAASGGAAAAVPGGAAASSGGGGDDDEEEGIVEVGGIYAVPADPAV